MTLEVSEKARALMKRTLVWDNHACMPLRPDDESFLPQLSRHRAAGASVVSLNISMDHCSLEQAFLMLASFRDWVARHADEYVLADTVADIEAAKASGKLAIVFDLEGGAAVARHIGLVEIFYRLGVRWMLIAYNQNNALGGGCQDADGGLSDYGRRVIGEMERVGMVLCCSHTGYRTAREAIEYSVNPVIFSHSNPRGLMDHPRNIPDDLIEACARSGGVIGLNGFGLFLGAWDDNSTDTAVRHIDYLASLVGAAHVGLGLDYVFDAKEMDDDILARPDIFPPEKGYRAGLAMIEPERIPVIAEALLKRGYSEADVQGVLGHNHLRVARQVWK